VSPILFAIYMADIHAEVEEQIGGVTVQRLSFVDDMTWLATADNPGQLVQKLDKCARLSLQWARENAVKFETTKTKAIPFSRQRKHWQAKAE